MNEKTAEVHRQIERFAQMWLDHSLRLESEQSPSWPTEAHSRKMMADFSIGAMKALGDDGIEFGPGQDAVLSEFQKPGPELVLIMATAVYVGFLKGPSQQCEHIVANPRMVMTDRTFIHAGLRQWACVRCFNKVIAMERAHAAEIEVDRACDVCDQEATMFQPHIIPIKGTIVVSFHNGECCDELLNYIEPDARYTKVPRNAPCPCDSGRKFKYCHGAPNPGRYGMGKPGNN